MSRKYKVLTEDQIEHFLEKGYIVLNECFPREMAEEWKAFAYERMVDYDPDDPTTWKEARVHLPEIKSVPIRKLHRKRLMRSVTFLVARSGSRQNTPGRKPRKTD